MCTRSYHHHQKRRHSEHGHWLAGKAERWAKHKKRRGGWFYPPVNIQELDDRYELFLFAPGLTKEDFQISLKDNLLKIAVDKKEEEIKEEGGFWKRKEFTPRGFQRKFELNEKIDLDAIKAKYENGILQLTLSKLKGEETLRKDIFIA